MVGISLPLVMTAAAVHTVVRGAHRLLIAGMHAAGLGWYEGGFDILSVDTHAMTAEAGDVGSVSLCNG